MAKKEDVAGKKRREVPPTVVELADGSEESDESDDDGMMKDEFEGLSDESGSIFESESESESEETGDGGIVKSFIEQVTADPEMLEMGYTTSEGDSMEGSRSRSEEDLRDIGSARRLDDDDTADSAWKETTAPEVEAGNPGPSSSSAPEVVAEKEKNGEAASGSGGVVAVARDLDDGENNAEEADVMETEEEEEEEEEEEGEDEEEDERLGADESQSEGEPSASEDGSDSDRGGGGKGDSTKSSAYSRAFSKILQSKAAKESDNGPVLAARQTLVARKLEEEAGETKEKKDTKKEKKELREKAHLYPQSFTDTKEKDLVKLATRGVVKLFNAVSKAQKVQASADGRDAKVVAKQSKAAFLAEVKGTSVAVGSKRRASSSSEPPFKFGTSESQNQSTSRWSVVKEDFMIGKQKLKDWDKDEEMGDAAGVHQMNNGIDDDSD